MQGKKEINLYNTPLDSAENNIYMIIITINSVYRISYFRIKLWTKGKKYCGYRVECKWCEPQ